MKKNRMEDSPNELFPLAGASNGAKLVQDFVQDAMKASGRQGEATIIGLPDHDLGPQPGRSSVFTIVPIGLEIRVLGLETYQVDKVFTFPTHTLDKLEVGKVVAVWVDPKDPSNHDKIVIDIK